MFYAIFYYVTLSFHFSFKLPIVHLNITDIHQHLRLFKGAVCNIQMINIAANSYLSQSCCINYNPNVSVLCWVASLAMRACYGRVPCCHLISSVFIYSLYEKCAFTARFFMYEYPELTLAITSWPIKLMIAATFCKYLQFVKHVTTNPILKCSTVKATI